MSQTTSQTEKSSFQLFSVPFHLQCNNYDTANWRDARHTDKTKAQPLGSRLKQWNLLEKGVIVSFYKKRQSDIATYYSRDGDMVYWNNNQELMQELQLERTSGQWTLSLIHLRSVWRQCYSTMETSSLLSHRLMHLTWKKRTRSFRLSCKKYAMKNTGGIYVLT